MIVSGPIPSGTETDRSPFPPLLEQNRREMESLCLQFRVRQMSVFGSILADHFHADSDVDLLVEFEPDSNHTLFDLVELKARCEEILGREVDIVCHSSMVQSRNQFRANHILTTARYFCGS